jgi:uncharacterized caspase-like protein
MKFSWRPPMLFVVLIVAALFFTPCAHAQKDSVPPEPAPGPENAGTDRPIADKWALVIGVSKFSDPLLGSLRYAAKDAQDFADFLVEKEKFAADHVRVLLDQKATQSEILSEIGDKFLRRVVKPDDLVVLYYSGRGTRDSKDIKNERFLVAYDTDKSKLRTTAIQMQELTRILRERVLANRVLIIMDAGHSGGGADGARAAEQGENSNLSKLESGDGQYIVSSCSGDQRSWESKRYKNGIFTHYLMDELRRQQTLGEAIDHSRRSIINEVQEDDATVQTPVVNRSGWKGDDLVLSAIPFAPRPMPQSVKDLLDSDGRKSKPTPPLTKRPKAQVKDSPRF